jgi:hypothetical protein
MKKLLLAVLLLAPSTIKPSSLLDRLPPSIGPSAVVGLVLGVVAGKKAHDGWSNGDIKSQLIGGGLIAGGMFALRAPRTALGGIIGLVTAAVIFSRDSLLASSKEEESEKRERESELERAAKKGAEEALRKERSKEQHRGHHGHHHGHHNRNN